MDIPGNSNVGSVPSGEDEELREEIEQDFDECPEGC